MSEIICTCSLLHAHEDGKLPESWESCPMHGIPTEEQGIEMIIALQGCVNIVESKEQARAGWNAMEKWQKLNTARAYAHMRAGSPQWHDAMTDLEHKMLEEGK